MKTTFLKLSAFILLLALMGAGCEKESAYIPDPDPAKAILGKWICIESGGLPNEKPTEYIEYYPNGTRKIYEYETGKMKGTEEYWIDSLLHIGPKQNNGSLIGAYKYQFREDELSLTYYDLIAEVNFFVYKRIK